MKTMASLIFFLVFLSYPLISFGKSPQEQAVASICGHTHDPVLCTSTAARFANSYPLASINTTAVLQMNLLATSRRATAAKQKAATLAPKYPLLVGNALRGCNSLYGNIIDLVGVCTRAIGANDQQTKVMVQISLSEIKQVIQQCDLLFDKMKAKSPLMHFGGSLLKMSINCDDLNNMM